MFRNLSLRPALLAVFVAVVCGIAGAQPAPADISGISGAQPAPTDVSGISAAQPVPTGGSGLPGSSGPALTSDDSAGGYATVAPSNDSGAPGYYNHLDVEMLPAPYVVGPNAAVGGGTNGNISAVNAVISGIGLYIGNEWGSWTDTQRHTAITTAASLGFSFISPKIASATGSTWYSSGTQLDQWIAWCTQAGIKFFPFSYVNPSTGGLGNTIATNRAAAIAADIAQHCGIVLVDMEAEWQNSQTPTGYKGPYMTAFGQAYRSACPDIPIVVTGFGDPITVQGSQWPYAEMKSFADAYAPQWYYPWWKTYFSSQTGIAGVGETLTKVYGQCQSVFGSTYPMLPNAAWEASSTTTTTPAPLENLYAGTAWMRRFNAPIIWWEYTGLVRSTASALIGYGYFTDQPVPSGSAARPLPIVAPSSAYAGSPVTITINLGGPAPPGGQPITLTSSNPTALPVPSGALYVPRGASSLDVALTAGSVSSPTAVTITATNTATGATETTSKSITVLPPAVPLAGLTVAPASILAGQTATGTVTLSGPAPGGGEAIALSSDTNGVEVPAGGVTVPAGATTADFTINTSIALISAPVHATITASLGGASFPASLSVSPSPKTMSMTNFEIRAVHEDGADFYWNTDVASDTTVFYGTSPDTLNQSATGLSNTIYHATTITGLQPDTTYYARAVSAASGYAPAASAVVSFHTIKPIQITDIKVDTSDPSATTISWTVTPDAAVTVKYGPVSGAPDSTDGASAGTTSVTEYGLQPDTTYYYTLTASAYGYRSVTTPEQSFRTAALGAVTVSGVSVKDITRTSATVTWTSDMAATSLVHYGPRAGIPYDNTASTNGTGTSHSVTLTGLTPGQTVHFIVESGVPGYTAGVSPDATFTTLPLAGDVDGDGAVTPADAVAALQVAAGLSAADATTTARATVTGDTNVSLADAVSILRSSAGL